MAPNTVSTRQTSYITPILIQLAALAVVCLLVALWQREFLAEVYLRNQLTQVGWFINGGIVLLFLCGMYQLVRLFISYSGEEEAMAQFTDNVANGSDPEMGLVEGSIILRRYHTLRDLHHRRSPVNHNALAATLLADQSSRNSFPKFVQNVLILTGVFGTIVSLSIALFGASNMVSTATEIGGLGMVIHGMSAALSTTMTAILAYLIFGYFYLRLTDVQTHVISRVEEATATILLPRFQVTPETVIEDFADIIRAAAALVKRLDASQAQYAEVADELKELLASYRDEMQRNSSALEQMIELLREGFRLQDPPR